MPHDTRPGTDADRVHDAGPFLCGPMGSRRLDRTQLLTFAAAFDPQPQHLDDAMAQASPLRGLAASGWHTCALIARILDDSLRRTGADPRTWELEELRWLRPVRPGDEITASIRWTEEARPRGRGAESRAAIVAAHDQTGALVARWSGRLLLSAPTDTTAPHHEIGGSHDALASPRAARVERHPGRHLINYFEDIRCGDEILLGCWTFDEADRRRFESSLPAAGTQEAKRSTMATDPWHLIAAWMRLIVDYYHERGREVAAAGLPVPILGPATGVRWMRWLAPVSLGERITFRSWAEHKVTAGIAKQWGLLVAGAEGHNERGEPVVSFYPQFLMEKRPTAA